MLRHYATHKRLFHESTRLGKLLLALPLWACTIETQRVGKDTGYFTIHKPNKDLLRYMLTVDLMRISEVGEHFRWSAYRPVQRFGDWLRTWPLGLIHRLYGGANMVVLPNIRRKPITIAHALICTVVHPDCPFRGRGMQIPAHTCMYCGSAFGPYPPRNPQGFAICPYCGQHQN